MIYLLYLLTVLNANTYVLRCDKSNYKDYIRNKELTDYLVEKTNKGCQLKGFDFGRRDLKNAYFYKANLEGSVLSGSNLEKADFHKANLMKANIRNANLNRAKFHEADLRGVNLTGSDLSKAIFHYADLSNAILINVKAVGTSFCEADLRKSNFNRTRGGKTILSEAIFEGADISGADFGEVYIGDQIRLKGHIHDNSTTIIFDDALLDILQAKTGRDCEDKN